jgi:hypothetical protein
LSSEKSAILWLEGADEAARATGPRETARREGSYRGIRGDVNEIATFASSRRAKKLNPT